jgi:hypothetical protein
MLADPVVEPAAGTGSNATSPDRDHQTGLAGGGSTDQHSIRCWAMNTPPARSRTSISLIGVPSNWKSSRSLASGSSAMVSWYLIERACFSLISAVKNHRVMR